MRAPLCLLALAACGSPSAGAPVQKLEPDASADIATCAADPRVDAYSANLTKLSTSGATKIVLVSSDPAPPVRGTNHFVVKVLDAQGQPMQGAQGLKVDLWMPDHGHGSTVHAVVTPQSDGSFSVTPVYFFMGGVWRATFTMGTESAAFYFCVPG